MSQVSASPGDRPVGMTGLQIGVVVFAAMMLVFGFLVKIDRAPSFGEMVLDPVRLAIPMVLLFSLSLRQKIGVTRRFAMVGLVCVGLTVMSEVYRGSFGNWLLIPAFVSYAWMLGHCWKEKGIDSSWAGLALCLVLAPVF
ncbi:hypothetical protein CCB80_02480 [Armatimonadetes bacterium Uphvl-Ar1]|nr:hypothetical protein CCB80_02480 [Armatimonadetes bacterium Uphvl-Ar1]